MLHNQCKRNQITTFISPQYYQIAVTPITKRNALIELEEKNGFEKRMLELNAEWSILILLNDVHSNSAVMGGGLIPSKFTSHVILSF